MTLSAQRLPSSSSGNGCGVWPADGAGLLWPSAAEWLFIKSESPSPATPNGTLATIREVRLSFHACYSHQGCAGLLAMATKAQSTLLVIAGRQIGHVQLIHLPPCPSPGPLGKPFSFPIQKSYKSPTTSSASIIAAHTSALNTISLPPSGRLLATTSSRGTLVRIWDPITGKLIRELRRGADKAEIYGVAFRPDERELCVWSDKGTVHVFTLTVSGVASNRQSTFSPLTPFLPLPKYFESEWSYAQYRIPVQSSHISLSANPAVQSPLLDPPDEERCAVGWIQHTGSKTGDKEPIAEYQLIALTYTGGWYRLSLPRQYDAFKKSGVSNSPPKYLSSPRSRTSSGSSFSGRTDKGKEKEAEKSNRSDCVLEEYRRYGRWDGWG
ncbi:hypothetical protein AX15_002328 [Amanita polypyramis BW_CC]|nr:hypothetical protein AX15_002328 [Amanita polypyramis BW_CC]